MAYHACILFVHCRFAPASQVQLMAPKIAARDHMGENEFAVQHNWANVPSIFR